MSLGLSQVAFCLQSCPAGGPCPVHRGTSCPQPYISFTSHLHAAAQGDHGKPLFYRGQNQVTTWDIIWNLKTKSLTLSTMNGHTDSYHCGWHQQSKVAFVFVGMGSLNATTLKHSAVHFSIPGHKGQSNSFLKEGWTPSLHKYVFKPLLKGCTY